jgi:molybdate transport system ATP-binding protein
VSLELSVRSRFGEFLLDVAFDAPAGITALFGPSGAGKSLTLRCVAGLERVEKGRIVLDGRTLLDTSAGTDVPTRARRIGYVFQNYALFPHLSVAANVGYGLRGEGRRDRGARVDRMLALVGLEGYGDRSVAGLSGGEQQRIALVRSLATDPALLLLDEPFAALDHRARGRLRTELRRVQRSVATPMLLVTHDLDEVRQLADHVVLVAEGRTLQSGPTAEVLASPADRTVRSLLFADAE